MTINSCKKRKKNPSRTRLFQLPPKKLLRDSENIKNGPWKINERRIFQHRKRCGFQFKVFYLRGFPTLFGRVIQRDRMPKSRFQDEKLKTGCQKKF